MKVNRENDNSRRIILKLSGDEFIRVRKTRIAKALRLDGWSGLDQEPLAGFKL